MFRLLQVVGQAIGWPDETHRATIGASACLMCTAQSCISLIDVCKLVLTFAVANWQEQEQHVTTHANLVEYITIYVRLRIA